MKIRNISAPKANENSKTAPKLLKIQLTDGVNSLSAIEMEPTDLSIDTKPGIKVSFPVNFALHPQHGLRRTQKESPCSRKSH